MVLVADYEVAGVEGTGVLDGGGGVEAAAADQVHLLNHHRHREGCTPALEETKFILLYLGGCVGARLHNGWGWSHHEKGSRTGGEGEGGRERGEGEGGGRGGRERGEGQGGREGTVFR